jgi:hypothetical protein
MTLHPFAAPVRLALWRVTFMVLPQQVGQPRPTPKGHIQIKNMIRVLILLLTISLTLGGIPAVGFANTGSDMATQMQNPHDCADCGTDIADTSCNTECTMPCSDGTLASIADIAKFSPIPISGTGKSPVAPYLLLHGNAPSPDPSPPKLIV